MIVSCYPKLYWLILDPFDLPPHSPLSVLAHPLTLLEAAKKAKKLVGEVPAPGQGHSLIRLRTKTSSDSLADQYVTPPRKESSTPNESASTPKSRSTKSSDPSSFLGLQHCSSWCENVLGWWDYMWQSPQTTVCSLHIYERFGDLWGAFLWDQCNSKISSYMQIESQTFLSICSHHMLTPLRLGRNFLYSERHLVRLRYIDQWWSFCQIHPFTFRTKNMFVSEYKDGAGFPRWGRFTICTSYSGIMGQLYLFRSFLNVPGLIFSPFSAGPTSGSHFGEWPGDASTLANMWMAPC